MAHTLRATSRNRRQVYRELPCRSFAVAPVWRRHSMKRARQKMWQPERRSCSVGLQSLFSFELFHRKCDQFVDQFAIGQAARFPELWVHAYSRESRDGVDFIHDNFFAVSQEKIDAGHSFAAERGEGFDGGLTNALRNLRRDFRRYLQDCAVLIEILRLVRIKFMARQNLAQD